MKKIHADVLNSYPPVDTGKVNAALERVMLEDRHKIVVLDDDPTGVQTVHDISVYTDWSYESIRQGFSEKNKVFYVLTNSRGFTACQTTQAHKEIGQMIARVAKEEDRPYLVVSRGDSTLRGHYPLETELLKEEWEAVSGRRVDGEILCPYFKEGGRFTIGNVHYVQYGEALIPAGETEFAADKTFGYRASDLTEYIEEKSAGAYKKEQVLTISLEDIRAFKIEEMTNRLMKVQNFDKVVVNAIDDCDLRIFCIALYQALARGKYFLFRTAAGFVKALGGITDRPLLSKNEMVKEERLNGGIIVVGSHTRKTTQQLERLKELKDIAFIEFNSDLVLDAQAFAEEVARTVQKEEALIAKGRTVVVYTKRKLLQMDGDSKEDALRRSVKISEAVQSLVGNLTVVPSFVIAKGGITSSDVATKALRVKRATVLGQIQPGIPVWETGEESRFAHIPYIIFPGNVGEADTLKKAVEVLLADETAERWR